MRSSRISALPRRLGLALAVTALWGLDVQCASATSIFVQNCNDDGSAGSLRGAIKTANGDTSIDTVDLSPLATASGCSHSFISLELGEIPISRSSLTIKGPPSGANVDAGYLSRVFGHTGAGTLTLENMQLSAGYAYYGTVTSRGGCVYSSGSVYAKDSEFNGCYVASGSGDAEGGALFAKGTATLTRSTILANVARSHTGTARGGGIFFVGGMRAKYSTFLDNAAESAGAFGGAASNTTGAANLYMTNTTVSFNTSSGTAGGMSLGASSTITIVNSTIAHNQAGSVVGGMFLSAPLTKIYNSTIAYNTAVGSPTFGAGVDVTGNSGSTLQLNSVLISNNTASSGAASDLTTDDVVVSGSHNLVYASPSALPGDTIVGKCPLLAPLKSNGGPTATFSLHSASPAIDAGNNVRSPTLKYDQRGSPFPRLSGAAVDIGAFEVNQSETLFNASFEGCG